MLTNRTVARWFNDYLKIETFLANIEDIVDCWGQSIVGDLKNGGQDSDEHVSQIFKVI